MFVQLRVGFSPSARQANVAQSGPVTSRKRPPRSRIPDLSRDRSFLSTSAFGTRRVTRMPATSAWPVRNEFGANGNVQRVAWFTARRDSQAQRVIEQSGDGPSTVDEPAMRASGDQGDRRGSAGFGDHLVGAVPNDVMAACALEVCGLCGAPREQVARR